MFVSRGATGGIMQQEVDELEFVCAAARFANTSHRDNK